MYATYPNGVQRQRCKCSERRLAACGLQLVQVLVADHSRRAAVRDLCSEPQETSETPL